VYKVSEANKVQGFRMTVWLLNYRTKFLFVCLFLFAILGFELRTSCLLGRHSISWVPPAPELFNSSRN
jgi:hypothetical protein